MSGDLSGILIVDKPQDASSAKVVAVVKRLLGAAKVGHTGTLDPFATGVLICCINHATKLAKFFLQGDKKYEAVLHLGVETDTQDATGNVTAVSDAVNFSDQRIQAVFDRFKGSIEQYPPVYSALKHKGVPLYKLARRGQAVQKPPRCVQISLIEITEIRLPIIRFVVCCSAGTYVRTLCADIGAALGCGGHLRELRRTESSGFTIKDALTMPEIKRRALSGNLHRRIIGMSDALKHLPEHMADTTLALKIRHGNILTQQDVALKADESPEGYVKIVNAQNELLAVLKFTPDKQKYKYCCTFGRE